MKPRSLAHLAFLYTYFAALGTAQGERDTRIPLLEGEVWWGGWTSDGAKMPFDGRRKFKRDLRGDNGGNQAQPLLLSNRGRFLWNDEAFAFQFEEGSIVLHSGNGMQVVQAKGRTLASAFNEAAGLHFPADGRAPDLRMFTAPQYNTWIELMYDQNQEDILKYARAIIAQGYPPGVLMIDDNWQTDYGVWTFSRDRFSNPKQMVDELHALGFQVMLWVCPYVSPDSAVYRDLAKRGLLVREKISGRNGRVEEAPALVRWWNGRSGALDLTHPEAVQWFEGRLDALRTEFGIDGFKFDAGDTDHFRPEWLSRAKADPNGHTKAFADIGLKYPFNEYRATWKMAGQPLAQRLRDKQHLWSHLGELIPGILAQGVMGYAFTCPDMIGGGDFVSFLDGTKVDQELVVRSAQVHALMPMMQFSVAPWRVLSPENNAICLEMARLHTRHAALWTRLVKEAAESGRPIIRPLCWQWPDRGYEGIMDQFMVGDELLVAPVVTQGARTRRVVFPPGTWEGEDGRVFQGGTIHDVEAPLERLPHFFRR